MANCPMINKLNNINREFNLKIVSWNINDFKDGILGYKDNNEDFVNILSKNDIFCLQETKAEIKIPNYRCYNSLRSDSRSGGLCIGIRHDIVKHTKLLNTAKYSPDVQALEISTNLTGLSKKIILINVYDSPETSSYKASQKTTGNFKDTLSILNEFCTSLPINSNILLIGDFNARTGNLNSIAEDNDGVLRKLLDGRFNRTSHHIKSSRNSKDNSLNERGKKLIDFATEWNLSILNGSTIGDILGNWTCLKYNGQSVVDYMLASYSLLNAICSMNVLDFNEFSDHKPTVCLVKCFSGYNLTKGIQSVKYDDKPAGFPVLL